MPRFSLLRQHYGHIFRFLLIAVACLSAWRLALLTLNFSRIEPTLLPPLLAQGLRFDLLLAAYLAAPALLVCWLLPAAAGPVLRPALSVYYRSALLLVFALEAIGFGFLREYDHRPDALFWDYLGYPREVLPMLWGGFKFEIVIALLALGVGWRVSRLARPRTPTAPPPGAYGRLLAGLVGALLLAVLIRSSFGHRPANISSALFSDNRLANELALNSPYTASYALYARRHDSGPRLVPAMPVAEALATVAAATLPAPLPVADASTPSRHRVEPRPARTRPLNLVIVLEESLGAQFVGALGGADLTPRLDGLAAKGVWFTNMFATGTRTVRGIEAVLAGFPPSTARSVVKRSRSRRGFYTLAQSLAAQGYHNLFLYGGDANFDDMGSFMLGNGFHRVVAGAEHYPEAEFVGSWGVSDEDWARRAHELFEQQNANGPFFALMLSTSNHTPWEYPAGRIEPGEWPMASRTNAVRYADYALGVLFDQALTSDYASNTVFVVVADHDARVYGNDLMPVEHFRIPALIIAPGLEPSRYTGIASQIDLIPTLLPLLGVPFDSLAIGRDLFDPRTPMPGRALMQYGNHVATLWGEQLVVNTPTGQPVYYRYRGGTLEPAPANAPLQALASAYLNLAGAFYDQDLYRCPAGG